LDILQRACQAAGKVRRGLGFALCPFFNECEKEMAEMAEMARRIFLQALPHMPHKAGGLDALNGHRCA
jgi:hypothetical protein